MTKIKKSIWSAVVGVVMSLALVFGVFAGVNSNKVTNAAYDADQYVAEFKFIMTNFLEQYGEVGGYTTEMLDDDVEYTVAMEDGSFERTSTRMAAYIRAEELYSELQAQNPELLSVDRYIRLAVDVFNEIKDMIAELDPIIADIIGTEEGQLGYMIAREGHYYDCVGENRVRYYDPANENANELGYVYEENTTNGVIYSDTEAYTAINNAFEALDEHQQEYVRRQANRGYNLHVVGSALTVANNMMAEVKDRSLALDKAINGQPGDEGWVPGTGVLYSYKAEYDAIVAVYNKLDSTAQEETRLAATYGEISGLDEVFADIEDKADEAKEAIAAMQYWSPEEEAMVTVELGEELGENEVVVDTQETFDAATLALNSIYDGRTVNGFKVAKFVNAENKPDFAEVPEAEKEALATYFTDLYKYLEAEELLAEYQAEAAEVEADIDPLVVDAENYYKVAEVEGAINTVYAAYAELDVDGYDGHHNKQKYIAEANRAKIEYYNDTLVTLNAWIKGVAELVDSRNELEEELALPENPTVADVDAVIAWAYAKLQAEEDFGFSVDDFHTVEALLEQYDALVEVEDEVDAEARVNSLHDAHEVLVYIKDKIDEAIEEERQKVEELQGLLDTIGDLLANGVKYADKVTYDHFTEVYNSLSNASKETLQAEENWGNYDALGEALEVIADRFVALGELVDNIIYRHGNGEDVPYTVDTDSVDGEIVVYSKESVEAAKAAVEALYNGEELVAENGVEYKLATLAYPWAEDVVETADGNVNAFVHYFEVVDVQAYYDKYDAAVADLEALEAEAQEVEDGIAGLTITNYRAQRETIENLYNAYVGLDRGEYNNLQDWVDNGDTITTAHEVLVELDRWVKTVALAIDMYNDPRQLTVGQVEEVVHPTVEEVDALINNTTVEDVKLTLSQVNALLATYDTLTDYDADEDTRDAVKAVSVKEAHDLLVARLEDLEELIDEVEELLEDLEDLIENGIKYSYRETYDELVEKYEALDEASKARVNEETAYLNTVGYVGAKLQVIADRAAAVKQAIAEILYYLEPEEEEATADNCMVADPAGEVVYDSYESIKAVTDAVDAVYNGLDNIAELAYNWVGDEVSNGTNAFVYYEILTQEEYDKYDAALADYEALKAVADAVAERIDELELSAENHLKAQAETIETLFADTVRLTHEAEYIVGYGVDPESTETYFEHNNWTKELTEEQVMKIFNAYTYLETVKAFDLEVAKLADETVTDEATVEEVDAVLANALEVGFEDQFAFDLKKVDELYTTYNMVTWMFENVEQLEFLEDAFVAAAKPAKDVLDMMYNRAKELNNDLATKVVDILERAAEDALVEDDYDTILYVKEVYDKLTELQKAILENKEYVLDYGTSTYIDDETGEEVEEEYPIYLNNDYYYENGWLNIDPYTMEDFLPIVDRFEGANYYKQAVEELVTQLGETYFTVEGYVLEKGLLAMYFTFDDEMKAMVDSAYHKLLNIDAAYKEVEREDYTSYTTVTNDLEGQLDDAKTELAEAQEALETEIKEALGEADAETVKEALEAYKEAVEQAQADLEAAKDALVAEITNSLDPEAESVEAAFETYKEAVAQAQADLEAAQEELVTEIKTALGDEEAESVQAALENYKASVEETQAEQAQTQAEAAKAAEDGNKENDEKVAKLKKALIITAVVGGVVAVAAVACIVVLFAKMAALGGAAAGSAAAGSSAAGGAAGTEGGKEE